MERRTVAMHCGGARFDGALTFEPDARRRPLVMVFPSFVGRSDADLAVAERLFDAGYSALVCDVYGEGRSGSTREECSALMQPLLDDRAELQRRLLGWLDAARKLPEANPAAIGAIGFCFGGLCALDLARSGAALAGVASFHGLLSPGTLAPKKIAARVIVFHGWDDPMAPPDQVVALGSELGEAGADWQIHAYGGTMHGFTNPRAADPERGLLYSEIAAGRAWRSLIAFLGEAFG